MRNSQQEKRQRAPLPAPHVLHPGALGSVPYGVVLVRVRVINSYILLDIASYFNALTNFTHTRLCSILMCKPQYHASNIEIEIAALDITVPQSILVVVNVTLPVNYDGARCFTTVITTITTNVLYGSVITAP